MGAQLVTESRIGRCQEGERAVHDQDNEANLKLWLARCWIFGVFLALVVTAAFSFENGRPAPVFEDVLKWIGQILLPICLLVLSRVFGLKIEKTFGARLNRRKV